MTDDERKDRIAAEDAREWLHRLGERPENFGHKRTALKALDALDREPGLEADLERARAAALVLTSQCLDADALHLADEQTIRNVEALLARVREVITRYRCGDHGVRMILAALDAALAADAEPEGQESK